MTSQGFPMLGAGFIMSFFATGVIFLEGSGPFQAGHGVNEVLVASGRASLAAANVVKTAFKVISDLDQFVQS